MQYGDKGWQQWALGEDEAVEHIKYAYAFVTRAFTGKN